MSENVYITGMGIISALGSGLDVHLDAFMSGTTGIRPVERLYTEHRGLPAGEVRMTNEQLAKNIRSHSFHHFNRTTLLGIEAARQAWHFEPDKEYGSCTGLISATTVGGMDKSEVAYKKMLARGNAKGLIREMISHDCGDSTEKIASELDISGTITTVSTACSSSANAILLGARMIETGMLDKVLTGGTDALTLYTLNGFNSLQILDHTWCKPFDQKRKGLNLGEGAAYLVLESEASIERSGSSPICVLTGYGNANDAYHQTASSPRGRGALKAMTLALQRAGLSPAQIDYINVHGTATPNNDASESRAMVEMFGEEMPKFSSTKSFTGHTLGAAGAIEAVVSILAIQNDVVFPNLNFHTPIDSTGLIPETKTVSEKIKNVLSNSFGFGGNCSTLIFSGI